MSIVNHSKRSKGDLPGSCTLRTLQHDPFTLPPQTLQGRTSSQPCRSSLLRGKQLLCRESSKASPIRSCPLRTPRPFQEYLPPAARQPVEQPRFLSGCIWLYPESPLYRRPHRFRTWSIHQAIPSASRIPAE